MKRYEVYLHGGVERVSVYAEWVETPPDGSLNFYVWEPSTTEEYTDGKLIKTHESKTSKVVASFSPNQYVGWVQRDVYKEIDWKEFDSITSGLSVAVTVSRPSSRQELEERVHRYISQLTEWERRSR